MLPLEHSAILSTFIKLPFVRRSFVLSIFKRPLKTGFTVHFVKLHFVNFWKISATSKKVSNKKFYDLPNILKSHGYVVSVICLSWGLISLLFQSFYGLLSIKNVQKKSNKSATDNMFCLFWFFTSQSTIFQSCQDRSSWVEPVLRSR